MSSPTAIPIQEPRAARGAGAEGPHAALLGSASREVAADFPAASIQVWNFDLFHSQRRELRDDAYRIDFCLNRRLPDAQVCYADHWPAHRLERLGKLFLLPPGQRMQVKSGVGRQHVLLCRLPAERVRDWLDAEPDWTSRRLEASLDIPCNNLGQLLLRLQEEVRRPGFAGALMIEALAMQLAVEIERYYRQTVDEPAAGGLSAWRLRAIEERLRDGRAPPTLAELAAICRLSVRQLSRSFKAARGVSIGAHVAQSRVEAAKDLLGRGESVKAVAAALGFGAPSSFAYAFRKATGASPSAYRAQAGRLGSAPEASRSDADVLFS